MKLNYFFILIFGFIQLGVAGQESKSRAFYFNSINNLGLVSGRNSTSFSIQTVNGFRKGPWFAGVGLGFDHYQYRSIPLFADFRYGFGTRANQFFLYANAGVNFSWVQEEYKEESTIWNSYRQNDFKNGMYADAGIGVNISLRGGNAVVLAAGYSRKTMKEYITFQDWRTLDFQTNINSYQFNRIMVKLGFRL